MRGYRITFLALVTSVMMMTSAFARDSKIGDYRTTYKTLEERIIIPDSKEGIVSNFFRVVGEKFVSNCKLSNLMMSNYSAFEKEQKREYNAESMRLAFYELTSAASNVFKQTEIGEKIGYYGKFSTALTSIGIHEGKIYLPGQLKPKDIDDFENLRETNRFLFSPKVAYDLNLKPEFLFISTLKTSDMIFSGIYNLSQKSTGANVSNRRLNDFLGGQVNMFVDYSNFATSVGIDAAFNF